MIIEMYTADDCYGVENMNTLVGEDDNIECDSASMYGQTDVTGTNISTDESRVECVLTGGEGMDTCVKKQNTNSSQ